MIKSITKPSLLSGLQALTIPDTGLKPLTKYQDKMVRKTASVRKKASVVALEMILQISPLIADYHKSVLSLLYNMWVTRGSCYELMIKILEDQTLKSEYWPTNVNKILSKYELPGALTILKSTPIEKNTFKKFIKEKIGTFHLENSESKLMRSNLYRFIFKDDFSFERKKVSPMISAATTRKQIVGLKLNILHLIMEYPNNENRTRISTKKSKLCDICLEDGIEVVDSTEHNLFSCTCIKGEQIAATALAEIISIICSINSIDSVTITRLIASDPTQASLLLVNPCSSGLSAPFRVSFENPCIKLSSPSPKSQSPKSQSQDQRDLG